MLSKNMGCVLIVLFVLILAIGTVAAEQTNITDTISSKNDLEHVISIDQELKIQDNSSLLGDVTDGENYLEISGDEEKVALYDYNDSCNLNENQTKLAANSKLNTYIDVYDIGSQYDISVLDENNNIVGNAKIYVNGVLQPSVGGAAFIDDPFFNNHGYGYKTFNIEYKGDKTHYASSKVFKISSLTIDVGPQKVTLSKSQYNSLKKHKVVSIWLNSYKTHKVIKKYKNKKIKVKRYTKSKLLGTYKMPVADLYKSSSKTKMTKYGKYLAKKAKKIAKKKHLKVDGNTFKYKYKISNGKVIYKFYIKYYKYVKKTKKIPVYTKKKFRQYVDFWYDKSDSTYNYGVADNHVKYYDYVYNIKLY